MKNFKEFLNEQDEGKSERDRKIAKRRTEIVKSNMAVRRIENAGKGKTGTELTRARQNQLAQELGLRIEQRETPENDYEGDMASGELRNIISNAQEILKMLKPESKLEAWVQSKITKAEDYIDTVHDYIKNNKQAVE